MNHYVLMSYPFLEIIFNLMSKICFLKMSPDLIMLQQGLVLGRVSYQSKDAMLWVKEYMTLKAELSM